MKSTLARSIFYCVITLIVSFSLENTRAEGNSTNSSEESAAKEVLTAYLSAVEWRDRLQYVYDPANTESMMAQVYEGRRLPTPNFQIGDSTEAYDALGRNTFTIKAALISGRSTVNFDFRVVQTNSGYKIDWPWSMGFNEISPELFTATKPEESTKLHTWIKLTGDTYFVDTYLNKNAFIEIQVENSNTQSIESAYLDKSTNAGQSILTKLANGRFAKATLGLRFHKVLGKDGLTKDLLFVDRVYSLNQWNYYEKDFDEVAFESHLPSQPVSDIASHANASKGKTNAPAVVANEDVKENQLNYIVISSPDMTTDCSTTLIDSAAPLIAWLKDNTGAECTSKTGAAVVAIVECPSIVLMASVTRTKEECDWQRDQYLKVWKVWGEITNSAAQKSSDGNLYYAKIYCSIQGQATAHILSCLNEGRINITRGTNAKDLSLVELSQAPQSGLIIELPADFRIFITNGPDANGLSSVIEIYDSSTHELLSESSGYGPYASHGVED